MPSSGIESKINDDLPRDIDFISEGFVSLFPQELEWLRASPCEPSDWMPLGRRSGSAPATLQNRQQIDILGQLLVRKPAHFLGLGPLFRLVPT